MKYNSIVNRNSLVRPEGDVALGSRALRLLVAGVMAAAIAGCQSGQPTAPTPTSVTAVGARAIPPTSVAPTPMTDVSPHPTDTVAPSPVVPTPPAAATLTLGPTALPSPVDSLVPRPTITVAPTTTVAARLTIAATPAEASGTDPMGEAPTDLKPGGPPHDPGPLTWAHPGPYVAPGYGDFHLASFGSSHPLVATYYFYWTNSTDAPGQQWLQRMFAQRPPDPSTYSFLNAATHRTEFENMQAAGVDFALPVYWGEPGHPGRVFNPSPGHFWSIDGIAPMVQALDEMAAAGHPFKVGLFYDTSILANADLTTPAGKEYFYLNIRDYFSRIPPKYWAAIGGKPVVWLYDTLWVSRFDQAAFTYVDQRFAQDFGGLQPYVVRNFQWYQSKNVQPQATIQTDNLYVWGAGPFGFNEDKRLGVAEVGPGFKNSQYCAGGPANNCFDISRQNGAYYTRQLQAALKSGRKILAIETWNEFCEGTDVTETSEFGRKYIDLTRQYADAFHAGRRSIGG